MTCQHIPSEPIAAFCFLCKYCGEAIEAIGCMECDGIGNGPVLVDGKCEHASCLSCNGTGVGHWEVMK